MDAVAGFSRKENKPFSEFWDTVGFNKYMKTCLWNLKNKKGARISKRYHINKNTVDITEYNDILLAQENDTSGVSYDSIFEELSNKLEEEQLKVINIMCDHPEYIKPSGKVNVSKLSAELGCCSAKARKIISEIKNKIKLDI